MKYEAPSGYEFEIPDDWLAEAGVAPGVTIESYEVHDPQGQSRSLQLSNILTSPRHIEHFKPPGSFECRRMVSVLRDLRDRMELWPVDVWPLEPIDRKQAFQLFHGYHRYHACVAIGMTEIAVIVSKKSDLIAKREPSCGSCGGPMRRVSAGTSLRVCEDCFATSA